MKKQLKILSLGAGVQSTTMALMAEHGEIQKPDYAIFADTGWEPEHVYKHLEWLKTKLSYPIHVVSSGNIRDDIMNGVNSTGQKFQAVPFFVRNKDGSGGIARRQCTSEYKLTPIRREVSRLVTEVHSLKKKPETVIMYLGISLDEVVRMKPSDVKYIKHVWPLIELRMTRSDCKKWMRDNGYPEPPRSACIGCPYHSNREWRDMKLNDPKSFKDAIEVDNALRVQGHKRFDGELYLHNSLKPLSEVDFRNNEDKGQTNLFANECEGMCGV